MESVYNERLGKIYNDKISGNVAIKASKLTKEYKKNCAIDNLSFMLPKSGIIGLVGRNGSGKTTLMKLISGLISPTNGSINVLDMKPFDNRDMRRDVVYLYHNYCYPDKLKIKDIFKMFSYSFEKFDMDFVKGLLQYFGMDENMKYDDLSKGMASAFNFICAIACRTEIVLLDEPILGMDITVRKQVYEILQKEYEKYPRTFIISSHLISELEEVITECMIIDNGKLELLCNMDDFRENIYKVCGDIERLDAFCVNRDVIYRKNGTINSYAVIMGEITDELESVIHKEGLSSKAAKLEDIFISLTGNDKDSEMEQLWDSSKL